MRILAVFIFIVMSLSAFGVSDTIDLNSRPRLIGGVGTRNTFLFGFSAPTFHAKIGVEYNKKLRMGAGFCWLRRPDPVRGEDQTPFIYYKPIINDANQADTVPSQLHLLYFTYFADYVYYTKKRWEMSIPIQLGFGQFHYQYNSGSREVRELEQAVFLYEPAVSVQFKPLRWIALGADIGYRFMLVDKKLANGRYNSPIYDLKLMILWGEIYRALFPR